MKINKEGLELIKKFEGLKLKSYLCPAKVWTIGYGHTKGVKEGQKITEEEATKLLLEDISIFENGVNKLTQSKISENQFSALVSFTFNLGLGNLKSSTLLKKVNNDPNDPTIKDEFVKWNKAGGKVLLGLTNRRKDEANLYFKD